MPRSLPYITPQGFRRLQVELDDLWHKRADVCRALSAAAAEGDRSENAEYIYRKKQLREIDRRIRYLQKRLPELKVVNEAPADRERVYFGARITLQDEKGDLQKYRIVCSDEYDPDRGDISMDSPLANSMLGKRLDEEFQVKTPSGQRHYIISAIVYDMCD